MCSHRYCHILTAALCLFIGINGLLFAQSSYNPSPEKQTLYEHADELLEAGQVDAAIDALESILVGERYNPKFGDGWNRLALAYMARNSMQDRIKAQRALENALKVEYTSIPYNMNMATLQIQMGNIESARERYEKLIDINPDAVDAYLEVGRIYTEEMNKYSYMISLDNPNDMVAYYDDNTLRLAGFAANERRQKMRSEPQFFYDQGYENWTREKFDKAKAAFEYVLTKRPGDRDATLTMGLLALFREDWETLKQCAGEVLDNNLSDWEGGLYLGLALMRLREYELASEAFDKAQKFMPADARGVFDSHEYFRGPVAMQENMQTESSDRYWPSRDPLFLTPFNERQMEHFARVAEANLRFTVRANTGSTGVDAIPGWKTERGMTFIKYGKPPRWWRMRDHKEIEPEKNIFIYDRETKNYDYIFNDWSALSSDMRGIELWMYPQFAIGFHDPYGTSNAEFAPNGVFAGAMDFKSEAKVVMREYDELTPEFVPHRYDLPVALSQFRGDGGATELRIDYGMPPGKLRFTPGIGGYVAPCQKGFFLTADSWATQERDIGTITISQPQTFSVSPKDVLPATHRVELLPGAYQYAMEVQDEVDANTGVARGDLAVKDFSGKPLAVSDILFANDITPPANGIARKRSDFDIRPNVSRSYPVMHPVFLYYEIYNLVLDPGVGRSRYQVDCTFELEEPESKGIWRFLSFRRNDNSPQPGLVTMKAVYEGTETTEKQYLKVQTGNAPPGSYTVRIIVRDLLAQTQTEQTARMQLQTLEPDATALSIPMDDVLQNGRAVVALEPDDPLSHYHLGVLQYNSRRLDEAVKSYRQSLHLREDVADTHYAMALALRDKGAWATAITHAERALVLDKGNRQFRSLAGSLSAMLGRYVSALEILQPGDTDLHQELNYAFGRQLQLPVLRTQALQYFDRATQTGGHPAASYALGQTFLQLNNQAEAGQWLHRARAIDPHYTMDYLERCVPDRNREWLEDARYDFPAFTEVHILSGGADSTTIGVEFMALAPEEIYKSRELEYNARLLVFDARWTLLQETEHREKSRIPDGLTNERDLWFKQMLSATLTPGRYHFVLSVVQKNTRHISHVVQDLFVPEIGEEGLSALPPRLFARGRATNTAWFVSGHTMHVEVPVGVNPFPAGAKMQWQICDYLSRDKRPFIRWYRKDKRNVHVRKETVVGGSADATIALVDIPLQGIPDGAYLLQADVRDKSNELIGRMMRRFSIGMPDLE
jgi:GWxTD domain-containing protein